MEYYQKYIKHLIKHMKMNWEWMQSSVKVKKSALIIRWNLKVSLVINNRMEVSILKPFHTQFKSH